MCVCVCVCAVASDEFITHLLFLNNIYIYIVSKVKLATVVEGDQKAPFSIASTPRCRGGRNSLP